MKISVRTTTFDLHTGMVNQVDHSPTAIDEQTSARQIESQVIGLYPSYTYQKFEGYGCALLDSTGYILANMTEQNRRDALRCWFGTSGIDARFIRSSIDSCDYSLDEYQAVEDPIADPLLETFSIKRDLRYIIPVIKEAMELSGHKISVLLSPWSPPAAWKTASEMAPNDAAVYGHQGQQVNIAEPGRCFGGRLKPEYYRSWAKYLVKYVQAYLAEEVPVTMLSVQNESNAATNWDSCVWSGEQEKVFLRDHLYPELKAAGLTDQIGLYIWDHNKERMIEHVDDVMDSDTEKLVAGFAYHWYTGDHFNALSMLHDKYPNQVLLRSEGCGLHLPGQQMAFEIPEDQIHTFSPEMQILYRKNPLEVDFEDAVNYAHDIIGDFNHGMNRWIDWTMIVDRKGGPRHVPGGFVATMVAEDDGGFTKTVSHVYVAQIAKTIRPDAVRIGVSSYSRDIEVAAARNADGKIGLVLLSHLTRETGVSVRISGQIFQIPLPGHSLTTVSIEL